MYVGTVHILIEQGLQNIGVLAYGDFLPQELDLAINSRMIRMMDEQVQPLKNTKSKELKFKLQYILDRFQNLQVKEQVFAVTLGSGIDIPGTYYFTSLPSNYLHLIADVSQVLRICNTTNVATDSIQQNSFYLVQGGKSIIYNGHTYTTGQIFQGVSGITGYTYTGTGTLLLVLLDHQKRANRLTEEEYLYQVLDNALEGTDDESPVSSLSSNTLYIYVDGFYINQVWMTYLRKPNLVNSLFTTYSTATNLTTGSQYESVDNPITYNGVVYQPFNPFTVVTGHLTYTGTATVRAFGDGDCEFTDSMAYVMIEQVILDLSIKSEQEQQKVANLSQLAQEEL